MLEVKEQMQSTINVLPAIVAPDSIEQLAEEARKSNTLEATALRASQIGRRLRNRSKDRFGADVRPATHVATKRQQTAEELSAQQQTNLAKRSRSKNMWN